MDVVGDVKQICDGGEAVKSRDVSPHEAKRPKHVEIRRFDWSDYHTRLARL